MELKKVEKIKYFFLVIVFLIFNCKYKETSFIGNWSMITGNKYYEANIDSNEIFVYHRKFNYWPNVKKYKVDKDSFFLDLDYNDKYKIGYSIVNKNTGTIKLYAKSDTILLIKISENAFTFDKINDSIDELKYKITFVKRMNKIMDSINDNSSNLK